MLWKRGNLEERVWGSEGRKSTLQGRDVEDLSSSCLMDPALQLVSELFCGMGSVRSMLPTFSDTREELTVAVRIQPPCSLTTLCWDADLLWDYLLIGPWDKDENGNAVNLNSNSIIATQIRPVRIEHAIMCTKNTGKTVAALRCFVTISIWSNFPMGRKWAQKTLKCAQSWIYAWFAI